MGILIDKRTDLELLTAVMDDSGINHSRVVRIHEPIEGLQRDLDVILSVGTGHLFDEPMPSSKVRATSYRAVTVLLAPSLHPKSSEEDWEAISDLCCRAAVLANHTKGTR